MLLSRCKGRGAARWDASELLLSPSIPYISAVLLRPPLLDRKEVHLRPRGMSAQPKSTQDNAGTPGEALNHGGIICQGFHQVPPTVRLSRGSPPLLVLPSTQTQPKATHPLPHRGAGGSRSRLCLQCAGGPEPAWWHGAGLSVLHIHLH